MSRKATLVIVLVGIIVAGCTSSPPAYTPQPPSAGQPGWQSGAGPPGPPTMACKPTGKYVKTPWGVVPECE